MELTILLPCLNEENTVAVCVMQAAAFFAQSGVDGEVLVVDNGSRDVSVKRAMDAGARVICCEKKGYGNALRYGIEHAAGDYVIMADCDCSYHFDDLWPFVWELRGGADMVIGDRFAFPCEKGARYGTPRLSSSPRCASRRTRPIAIPNSPAMAPKTVSRNLQIRTPPARSRFGSTKPHTPAMLTVISAVVETRFASTAAVPTTMPPMIDTA